MFIKLRQCFSKIEFLNQMKASVQRFEESRTFERILPRTFAVNNFNLKQDDDIQSLTQSLSQPVYDLLDRGGKRWRPALCFLIADLFNRNHHELYEVAATVELIHNATLIVDDIEDDSYVRRGDKCIHLKYGIDIAVNAGNFAYFAPLQYLINQPHFPEQTKIKILQICLNNMTVVHLGQAWDIKWHKPDCKVIPTEEQYLKMAEYKTGALSNMAAQLSCAVLEKDDYIGIQMAKFAAQIGVAFQIKDDILNLNGGDKYKNTKGYLGEDIHEGKFSLIVIHSLNQWRDSKLHEILKSKTADQNRINEAIEIIKKTGSLEYAKKRSEQIIQQAKQQIENIEFESPEAKSRLIGFADNFIQRDK